MTLQAKRTAVVVLLLASTVWFVYSFEHHGLVRVLVDAMRESDRSLELLRGYIARWGRLAPLVYLFAVIIEVLVAPIPGALLYAPGGVLFGTWLGGTLSLAGNVIGSAIACWLARTFGDRVVHTLDHSALGRIGARMRTRGFWVILLLRANPLTSSDLVSYAAGLVGVPVWQVALGTLIGMAPQCYAQSFLAERLLPMLPGSAILLVLCGVVYAAIVVTLIVRSR